MRLRADEVDWATAPDTTLRHVVDYPLRPRGTMEVMLSRFTSLATVASPLGQLAHNLFQILFIKRGGAARASLFDCPRGSGEAQDEEPITGVGASPGLLCFLCRLARSGFGPSWRERAGPEGRRLPRFVAPPPVVFRSGFGRHDSWNQ